MRSLVKIFLAVVLAPASFAAGLQEMTLPNGQTKTFSQEDLEAEPQVEIVRNMGNTAERLYSGPALGLLLAKCGIGIGEKMKGDELRFVVLVTGADGYTVALSLAELEPSISEGKIIVALKRDHAPVSPDEGPLRLVLEKDRRPVRWVKNLMKITVSNATSAK